MHAIQCFEHHQLTIDPHPLRLKLAPLPCQHINCNLAQGQQKRKCECCEWPWPQPKSCAAFFFGSPQAPIPAPTGWVLPQPAPAPATQNSSPYPSSSPERTSGPWQKSKANIHKTKPLISLVQTMIRFQPHTNIVDQNPHTYNVRFLWWLLLCLHCVFEETNVIFAVTGLRPPPSRCRPDNRFMLQALFVFCS